MKIPQLYLMIATIASSALADDEIEKMNKRFAELETERLDYRKPKQELPQDKETERQAVIGWLYVNDRLWRLWQETNDQLNALANSEIKDDRRSAEMDGRRKALSIIAELYSRPESVLTDKELQELRALIAIGDRSGLEAWQESKRRKSNKADMATPRKPSD